MNRCDFILLNCIYAISLIWERNEMKNNTSDFLNDQINVYTGKTYFYLNNRT